MRSPWLAHIERPVADKVYCAQKRTLNLPDHDLEATGSFLEYLYNGEYFPRLSGERKDAALEKDPSLPAVDEEGQHLLKHARVYTLAEKFNMPVSRGISGASDD